MFIFPISSAQFSREVWLYLGGDHTLFDGKFRAGALDARCGRFSVVTSTEVSRSVGEAVSRDIFLVGLAYDAERSSVCVWDVCHRVPIQCGLMGNRTHLLNGMGRGDASWRGEGGVKGIVIAESDVRAGAQRSRPLSRGGRGRRGLGCVLIQSIKLNRKSLNVWYLRWQTYHR